MSPTRTQEVGASRERVDGRLKVLGLAPYAFEQQLPGTAYLRPLQSAVARGTITAIDTKQAEAVGGVLAVITHQNAPALSKDANAEQRILQGPEVAFRGQVVGGVLAESPHAAEEAAALVRFTYDEQAHDARLRADHPAAYAPESVNPSLPTDSAEGDLDAGLARAAASIDETYTTPMEHNNPMEPHSTVAVWSGDGTLVLHESTQGVHAVRKAVATAFGLGPDRVRVHAPYVGGGFGSKGELHAHAVLAVMAAQAAPGRAVKLALTRRQMTPNTGHRTPTIQRLRLGADATGRLTAIAHDAVGHTSALREFAEQTAVVSRTMYDSASRATSHRLVPLDVPVPSWMRAPGECPGMFAAECAMDELAIALSLDPIDLRVRNEPAVEPGSGLPYSSRNVVACMREGAERFGWAARDPRPGRRREGRDLVGTGMAAATYPTYRQSGTTAAVDVLEGGCYRVSIGAVDIGTGAWTALTQIAADALRVRADAIELRIGDSALPPASVAGGSSGTTTWGSAIVAAAKRLFADHGDRPAVGVQVSADTPPATEDYAMHAFGAHFAEVRVDADTGEVRVARMLGTFAAGTIVNPRTARSQFIGGMTMGLSMALHEASIIDDRFGHVMNADLAEYHVATHADVPAIEAHWIDEHDPHVNPVGSKGIGEIGIVGAAAAIANAVHHATGIRVRDLPITPDDLLEAGA